MSDTYKYEDGAIHHDNKKVLHIDKLQGEDLQQLIHAFFKDDVEEAEYEEVKANENDNDNGNEKGTIDNNILRIAVGMVKQYMWAASAYAVLFCVCRDKYEYPDNMSQFERELPEDKNLPCTTGTIASAFRYNAYMKLNVDKWKDNGAKERVLILKEKFIEVIDKIISQKPS